MRLSNIRNLVVTTLLLSRIAIAQDADAPEVDLVGRTAEITRLPVNQLLTPYGKQLQLPGMRPQVLALSHNRKWLAVSGKTSDLLIVNPETNEVAQRVRMPDPNYGSKGAEKKDALVSFTGLIFSHDDSKIYLSDVNGTIKEFDVDKNGIVTAGRSIVLPPAHAPRRAEEIPSGLALTADGKHLFVCGNLSNKLLKLDLQTGQVTSTWTVGVAPYDVVLVGDIAVVSNWGGRLPDEGSTTGPAGKGTTVRVDPVRYIANEGSISLVDVSKLPANENVRNIVTGLHASALAVHPNQQLVVCANAADDNLSVVSLSESKVVGKIWTKISPADLFGAAPNALAFDKSGERLFVANGSQNAIGVIEFEADDLPDSKLLGMIPVGWYPGALAYDEEHQKLFVANIKGLPVQMKQDPESKALGFNSHLYSGSLSTFELPQEDELAKLSELAMRNMRHQRIRESLRKPRPDQPPRAIPERIGEPSLIKHVVYVIKENRTYDQVFGAIGRGRGHADLCIFGRDITPNQHKMVDEFVLLDNTYCSGILSADGHQWSTSAIVTDYLEKSFAGFPRSYPDGMEDADIDAIAYSPAGFIWDNAVAHGVSIRNYGEFMMPRVRYRDSGRKGPPDFLSCYRTWKGESQEVIFESEPGIESIRTFSPRDYVGWEMNVPDQFRADFILNELKQFEAKGEFPQLTIICLPNDHASGTKVGCPTPAAYLADNDLAFGRIVEALSRTKFWSSMAIFAIEDDPQAGWDHVSGYRTTAYVVSPYAKRGELVSTQYNTTSLLRTMEQILGLPPMNQFDASATPMFDCFTDKPNFAPFASVPNNVPLDQMNPDPKAMQDPILRQDALDSAEMNFAEVDRAPEDLLNRILWRAMKGTQVPYPEWAAGSDPEEEEDGEQ